MDVNRMLVLLRDSAWGGINALIALIAVVIATVSVLWVIRLSQRKTLDYEIIASAPLSVYAPLGIRPRGVELTVTLGKETVANLTITILRVRNGGFVDIVAKDYERPLMFKLPGAKRILSADVTSTNPKSLHPDLEWLPHEVDSSDSPYVRVTPCLINKRDFFEITVLCEGLPRRIEAEARITGISDVRLVSRNSKELRSFWHSTLLSLISMTLAVVSLLTVLVDWSFMFRDMEYWLSALLTTLTIVAIAVVVVFSAASVLFSLRWRR